jgi:bifunctional N-acetylglucosamine-1-phosphate-uridyltransferase/glucosamine-1-phosphate-acetyltransferase GlmU-like protein
MHELLKFHFRNETLHVSDSSSVHHQELPTVHSAVVYVTQTAFEQQQEQDGTGTAVPSCSSAVDKCSEVES